MSPEAQKPTLLERRRIEAEIVKPIYEALKRELGVDHARRIIGDAIKGLAVEAGRALAACEANGPRLAGFAALLPTWQEGDALRIEPIRQTENALDFDVHRCRYAEMYREEGIEEIGDLLSCSRDGSLCEGYDPRLKLTRTQAIMQGADRCDFRFRWKS
jgi:hypothetical protein